LLAAKAARQKIVQCNGGVLCQYGQAEIERVISRGIRNFCAIGPERKWIDRAPLRRFIGVGFDQANRAAVLFCRTVAVIRRLPRPINCHWSGERGRS
jgi:hypothetical protein